MARRQGPLSGVIDENQYIWGRGAFDMKSLGVLEMEIIYGSNVGIPPHRDVILLAVGDEVEGLGVQDLVKNHWDNLIVARRQCMRHGRQRCRHRWSNSLWGVGGEKGLLAQMTAKGPPDTAPPSPRTGPTQALGPSSAYRRLAQEISQSRIPDTKPSTMRVRSRAAAWGWS